MYSSTLTYGKGERDGQAATRFRSLTSANESSSLSRLAFAHLFFDPFKAITNRPTPISLQPNLIPSILHDYARTLRSICASSLQSFTHFCANWPLSALHSRGKCKTLPLNMSLLILRYELMSIESNRTQAYAVEKEYGKLSLSGGQVRRA